MKNTKKLKNARKNVNCPFKRCPPISIDPWYTFTNTYELNPAVCLLITYAIIVNKWTYTIVHVMFTLAEIPQSSHADWYMCIFINKKSRDTHTVMESLFTYMYTCTLSADTHLWVQSHLNTHTNTPHTLSTPTHRSITAVDAVFNSRWSPAGRCCPGSCCSGFGPWFCAGMVCRGPIPQIHPAERCFLGWRCNRGSWDSN